MKRYAVLIPLAFLIGAVIGSWEPRNKLARLSKESVVERREATRQDGIGAITRFANIPETSSRQHKPRTKPQPVRNNEDAPEIAVDNDVEEVSGEPEDVDGDNGIHHGRMDLRTRIDEAREVWKTRVDVARATAIANLKLNDEGVRKFDEALAAMNDRLLACSEALANRLKEENGDMTQELGITVISECSAALADAYEQIGVVVDPSLRNEVSELEIYNFIDPSVADPLVQVQDRLD